MYAVKRGLDRPGVKIDSAERNLTCTGIMRFIAALMLAALCCASRAAKAADVDNFPWVTTLTGNHLFDACRSTYGSVDYGICTGFVIGVVSEAGVMHWTFPKDTACLFDIPRNATGSQLVDIVKKGLTDHPEERQNPGLLLVIKYIGGAFPCSK